jgi:hypothetical protein
MFDYEHALSSSTEYTHMKAFVDANPACPWEMQTALATIETSASAPTLFFHNTDDYFKDNNKNPQGLYATQAGLMKARLDAVGTPTETLTDYSSGHAVPQTTATLQVMYDFLLTHISHAPTGITQHPLSDTHRPAQSSTDATFNLMGSKVSSSYKGLVIQPGRIRLKR